MTTYTCPYCQGPAHICDSARIYGRSYGQALICDAFPRCDSFVGCHHESGAPKGTIANAELRDWRKRAHAAFDPLWKDGKQKRHHAYEWLRLRMGLTREQCHIGLFNVAQCQRVIELIRLDEECPW